MLPARNLRTYTHVLKRFLLVTSLLTLTACDLAPEFALPAVAVPTAFTRDTADALATVEPASDGKWKRVDDKARIVEFAWWRMFHDGTLSQLIETGMQDNPTLDVALARVQAARAAAGITEADLYPAISVGAGPERSQSSKAVANAGNSDANRQAKPHTFYRASGTITYELDLFGRNRNRAREAEHEAIAEEDNYLAARLALQTEIAQTYYRLAALTAEDRLLTRTLATREQALALTRTKYEAGAVDALVLSSSEADLAQVKAEAASVADAKAKAEHALSVLLGKPPAEMHITVDTLTGAPPTVPAGLPSSLLERRPDIRRAVESMKAANARIGVVRTGFFPVISLSAMGGFASTELSELFTWSNRTWAIGPLAGTVLTQPLFEGGRLAASKAQADAEYTGAVARYREAVLTAFREVEDQLSGVAALEARTKATRQGLEAAARAYKTATARYETGYSSHLEFLDAERNNLAAERAAIQARGEQFVATIALIKALGGSWQKPEAPEGTGTLTEPPRP